MSLQERIVFSSRMLRKQWAGQSTSCPYCASGNTRKLARKRLVLQLRECQQCRLMFRYPKDDLVENFDYYQQDYQQATVTDLPTEAELPGHIANNFRNVGRDLTEHLKLIKEFSTGRKLLDFGASWGYCTWQFQRAGYDAVGFEISRPRTTYGQKMLGVSMVNSTAALSDHSVDVIYASHVLEHMPDPGTILKEFHRLLIPGGHIFIFVPNGAGEPARRLGVNWPPLINQRHVMAYTPHFLEYSLSAEGFLPKFASSPYNLPPCLPDAPNANFDGEELLAIGTAL